MISRRQFAQRLIGLLGALAIPTMARPLMFKGVPFVFDKDGHGHSSSRYKPLLDEMRNSFNACSKGSGAAYCPHTIHLSPELFRQFRCELTAVIDSRPPYLRFEPTDGSLRFKCAKVCPGSLPRRQYTMASGKGTLEHPTRLIAFTYQGN